MSLHLIFAIIRASMEMAVLLGLMLVKFISLICLLWVVGQIQFLLLQLLATGALFLSSWTFSSYIFATIMLNASAFIIITISASVFIELAAIEVIFLSLLILPVFDFISISIFFILLLLFFYDLLLCQPFPPIFIFISFPMLRSLIFIVLSLEFILILVLTFSLFAMIISKMNIQHFSIYLEYLLFFLNRS
jgi:hypothetical protein